MTLHNTQRLVLFEPHGAGMVMSTLHNADEVRAAEFDTKRQENIDPEMLDITESIIERRRGTFAPVSCFTSSETARCTIVFSFSGQITSETSPACLRQRIK